MYVRPIRRLALLLTAVAPLWGAPAAVAGRVPVPPLRLPGADALSARTSTWLLGLREGPATASLARLHGARRIAHGGAYAVATARAGALARAARARGLLWYAEPDVRIRRASFEADPDGWGRGAVVRSTLAPPSPTAAPIAVIDDFVDARVPDLAGHVRYLNATSASAIDGPHGTMVASAATASADGQGVLGVLPGGAVLSYGVPAEFGCAESAAGIDAAVEAGARVINMSYGHEGICFSEFVALQYALGRGVLAVAASGNEFVRGNPVVYPAALPHVLSVAALDSDLSSSYFSSANAAVDVAAPGDEVPLALPPAFDTADGAQDGLTRADGTSFAAPIAAGAAAWLLAARPGLAGSQAADLLRSTARDVWTPGYDRDTGFGLVDIAAALAAPVPHRDPLEPNDGMVWVNGVAFSRPDPFVWNGSGPGVVTATVDQVEDPLDVYRFRVPARHSVTISLRPRGGDPDLEIFDRTASSTLQRSHLIAASRLGAGRTDRVFLSNRGRRPAWAFVSVAIDAAVRRLDAGYRLTFHGARLR